jgi:hypothetical protein
LVDLSSSGMANEFYAAAVKSGTQSLKAWLIGSLDAANAITVDKPPAALWIMVLSARLFGFSSFSMLLPQALMGVGTVALTYATVKRWAGAGAGLVAGALAPTQPWARSQPGSQTTTPRQLLAGRPCTTSRARADRHSAPSVQTPHPWQRV